MPDLETLLREVRPEPDPAWAQRLDTRVANRFPAPPPRWRVALTSIRDHMLAIGAVATVASLLLVVVVAGISTNGGGSTADMASGGSTTSGETSEESADSSAGSAVPEAMATTSPKEPLAAKAKEYSSRSALPSVAPQTAPDRAVKTDTAITLSTTPGLVPRVADRSIIVVDSLGGYVQSSQVDQSGERSASAALSLRIPAARLDDALARISKLAHVKARSQQTQDLTDTRDALEASVRDARADRAGLRVRLAKATTDKERARLRAQLDRATRRVTQRQRRVTELGHEVSYASVELAIEGDRRSGAGAPPPAGRWTPGDAIGDAVRVLEVIAGVLVIALAVLLPVAVLAVLAALAGRVLTRRRRERALEMA